MWNFLTGYPVGEETNHKDPQEKLKEDLKKIKPAIRKIRPVSQKSTNSKKKQLQEDREQQIFKENQILLKKMIKIDSKPSSLQSFRTSSAKTHGRSFSRTQEQFKIFKENQKILKRLQSTNSHYSITRFEKENKFNQYLKQKICKKPKKQTLKPEKNKTANDLIGQILRRREIRKEKNI